MQSPDISYSYVSAPKMSSLLESSFVWRARCAHCPHPPAAMAAAGARVDGLEVDVCVGWQSRPWPCPVDVHLRSAGRIPLDALGSTSGSLVAWNSCGLGVRGVRCSYLQRKLVSRIPPGKHVHDQDLEVYTQRGQGARCNVRSCPSNKSQGKLQSQLFV